MKTRKQIVETFSGNKPENDYTMPTPTNKKRENGTYEDYWVMKEEERKKGFVRPVRRKMTHLKCQTVTTIHQKIAETYAANPKFYDSTFCCRCREHFPVSEFHWTGTDEEVGS